MLAMATERARPGLSPQGQRRLTLARIRRELQSAPSLDGAPARLAQWDNPSQPSLAFLDWLASRAWWGRELCRYLEAAGSNAEMYRRVRSIEVTWRHLVEDEPQTSIAERLRISTDTVSSDLTRALEWLTDRRLNECR